MASSTDSSKSSNSVLTNVPPPSALPSFLASPLPSATTAPPPSGSLLPCSCANSFNIITASGPPLPTPTTSVPSPLSNTSDNPPIQPFTSSSNITPPVPTSVQKSTAHPSSISGSSNSVSLPSGDPPIPPPQPQQCYQPAPNMASASPPTSQPFLPNSECSANASASIDLGSTGKKGEGGPGWLGWIRGTVSNVGHQVAERAKTSMDTMITTLDPQMKEFIHSGGDMEIIVASDKEVKVCAIREAFQKVFGKATVCGMKAEVQGLAAQLIGFEAAISSAEGRINLLRSSGRIHPQHPIVAVENFIVEFQPDCWFDIGLLLLDDPGEDILLQTYTQVTPVPPGFVAQARSATTEDYPFKDSGLAVTVGQIASENLQVHHSMWQESLTSVSRREALLLAGRTLAGLYRNRLPSYH